MQPRHIGAAIVVVFFAAVVSVQVRVIDSRRAASAEQAADRAVEAVSGEAAAYSPAEVVVSPRGVVMPVVATGADGWRVQTPCGHDTVMTTGRPMTPVDVVLDPGHGGEDSGAVGPNGLTEANLNLAVVRRAQAALERDGLSVGLTRAGDYNMNLDGRAKVAVGLHPRVFVSVHHNSAGVVASDRPGTETYHQMASPESKRLAGLVYEEVARSLAPLGGPWVAAGAGAKYMLNAGGDDYLAMLRRTQGVPSTLAELAYLSHAPEAALLAQPDTQRVEGEALARGIRRFLDTNDPGSGFVDPSPPPRGRGGRLICSDPAL